MNKVERQEIYREIRAWFITFTKQYNNNHPTLGDQFQHKKIHTEHVCELMKELTSREAWNDEDAWIALISARLHDIARFEQILHFKTYNDAKSFDHGERAVEILREKKVLARLSPETQNVVCVAIQYHNKKDTSIPKSLSQRELFFLTILRDADKIDNINEEVSVRAPNYKNEIDELIKKKVSLNKQVLASFFRGECVDYQDCHNSLDRILLLTSWIFDLNTRTAFALCKEHDWFNKLLDFLPQNESYVERARILIAKSLEEKLHPKLRVESSLKA